MTPELRIADVTQWYSPTSGGIRTYLHAKAEYASRAATPHCLIVTGPRCTETQIHASRLITVRGRTATERWGYRVALSAHDILDALDETRPTVVIVHDALAFPQAIAQWAHHRGAALVVLCHSHLGAAINGLPRLVRALATPLLNRVQARALRVGDLVVVASETTRERIIDQTRAPIMVSPLGITAAHFVDARPSASLRARLSDPGQTLLVYAGRLSGEKRVALLPDVLAALPGHYVLAIAGTGAATTHVARRARARGVHDRLHFLGHIHDRQQLATLLATADCFVHPNPDEPFGLAPLEALAAGCRVVAPRRAGAAEVLGGRGAVLVAPNDAEALARGIEDAMRVPPPRPDMRDLDWNHTFDREWQMYDRICR